MLTENIKYGRTSQFGPWNETTADRLRRSRDKITDHNGNANWYQRIDPGPFRKTETPNTPWYQRTQETILIPDRNYTRGSARTATRSVPKVPIGKYYLNYPTHPDQKPVFKGDSKLLDGSTQTDHYVNTSHEFQRPTITQRAEFNNPIVAYPDLDLDPEPYWDTLLGTVDATPDNYDNYIPGPRTFRGGEIALNTAEPIADRDVDMPHDVETFTDTHRRENLDDLPTAPTAPNTHEQGTSTNNPSKVSVGVGSAPKVSFNRSTSTKKKSTATQGTSTDRAGTQSVGTSTGAPKTTTSTGTSMSRARPASGTQVVVPRRIAHYENVARGRAPRNLTINTDIPKVKGPQVRIDRVKKRTPHRFDADESPYGTREGLRSSTKR